MIPASARWVCSAGAGSGRLLHSQPPDQNIGSNFAETAAIGGLSVCAVCCGALVAIGTKRTFGALQHFVRYWTTADIDQPLLELVSRSFDLVVDDLSRFRECLGGG
jgi:hypothetical protein